MKHDIQQSNFVYDETRLVENFTRSTMTLTLAICYDTNADAREICLRFVTTACAL